MMSETTVGWLLLQAASISAKAAAALPEGHPDHAFYAGKQWSAKFFAANVLPTVADKARLVALEDRSAIEIPAEAFATV